MIAPVIVVFHEARQGALEFPRAKVLLELDDVLHRPVVAFDLSLRHGVIGRAPRMRQTVRVQVVGQLLRDVAWAIITKQPGPMDDPHTVHPGLGPGQVERLGHVRRLHRRPKRPRQDVARVIVEHGRQVVPAPPDNLQVGEVGLPQLVGPVRRMSKCLAAESTTYAGLVIRSSALRMRYTLDSERKWRSRSVNCHASSRGDFTGSARAASTTRCRTRSGMRFQWRRAADGRGTNPAAPTAW